MTEEPVRFRDEPGSDRDNTEVLGGALIELTAVAVTGVEIARQVYRNAVKPFLEALADTPPDSPDSEVSRFLASDGDELESARATAHTVLAEAIDRFFDLLAERPQLQKLIADHGTSVIRGDFGRKDEDTASAG